MIGVTLSIPTLPPNRGNARMHWAKLHREDKAFKERAYLYLLKQRQYKPRKPWLKARINAMIVTTRKMDADNASARMKPFWDLLKETGWIVDDTVAVIGIPNVTPSTPKESGQPVGLYLTIVPENA